MEGVRRRSCTFDDYGETLLTWNRRVNLVSRDMTTTELDKHIRHCLMVAAHPVFQTATSLVDIGTGGGLPGIPLALAYPEKEFRLVDVVEKKCIVLREIVRSLHLRNVVVDCEDIRNLVIREEEVVLSKHAFKLPDIERALKAQPWRNALILKGSGFQVEADEVDEPWEISAAALSGLENDAFYADKFLLHIHRQLPP